MKYFKKQYDTTFYVIYLIQKVTLLKIELTNIFLKNKNNNHFFKIFLGDLLFVSLFGDVTFLPFSEEVLFA